MAKWLYVTINEGRYIQGIEYEIKEKRSEDSTLNDLKRRHDNPASHTISLPLSGIIMFLKTNKEVMRWLRYISNTIE